MKSWFPISTVPNTEYDVLVLWKGGGVEIMTGSTALEYKKPRMKGGGFLTHCCKIPNTPHQSR